METLLGWAQHSDVEIVSYRAEEKSREQFVGAEITVVLSGTAQSLAGLLERRSELPRVIRWNEPEIKPTGAELQLSIFARPPSSTEPPHPCRKFESRVWLPPYDTRIASARAKLEQMCAELSRLEAIDAQVQMFREVVRDHEERRSVIEHLREAQNARGQQ